MKPDGKAETLIDGWYDRFLDTTRSPDEVVDLFGAIWVERFEYHPGLREAYENE